MKDLLSIIIPCYNSSEFIDKCLQSVISSSYCNLEIIIIDDFSNDNTVEIVKEFQKNDKRISLYVNESNRGPGFCREKGVKNSSGKYITFVDADDTIDSNMYLVMIERMNKNKFDIIECGYNRIDIHGNVIRKVEMREEILYDKKCIDHYIKQINSTNYLWNKIFNKNLFNNIKYPNLFAGEDACILTQLYTRSRKTSTINEILYNYRINPNSLCGESFSEKKFDSLKAGEFMYKYNKDNNEDLSIFSAYYICVYSMKLYYWLEKSEYRHNKKLKKAILEYFDNYYKIISNNILYGIVSKKMLFLINLFKINKYLTTFILSMIELKNMVRKVK